MRPGGGQRGGVGEVGGAGRGGEGAGVGDGVFGGGPGCVGGQGGDDGVAGGPAGDAVADVGDDAGDVEVGDVGEGDGEVLLDVPGADRDVEGVERGACDLEDYLPGGGCRAFGFFVDEDAAVAVGVVADCLHDFSPE